MRSLTVRATGPLALVEDLGRPGRSEIGVGRSGAADRGALRLGNRLLGNPEDAAGVEVTGGGLEVEVGDEPLWACVTGAPCPVRVDDEPVGSHAVLRLAAGARLGLGPPSAGVRSYLVVRGGVAVAAVLGSRSRDVLAELGPAPLAPGDVLPVGTPSGALPDVDAVPPPRRDDWHERPVVLRAVRGPRDDWVVDSGALVAPTWEVSERSDRVGARLRAVGPDPSGLAPAGTQQLPSEGVWRGGVQVPPGGEPVLFLADHPVTGGYPVIAVVVDADVDRAAQLRAGQRMQFRWVVAP